MLEEARRTGALGDRCIVTIYGVLEYQGHSAIAMELVDGHELQNVSSVLEPRQIAKIISKSRVQFPVRTGQESCTET